VLLNERVTQYRDLVDKSSKDLLFGFLLFALLMNPFQRKAGVQILGSLVDYGRSTGADFLSPCFPSNRQKWDAQRLGQRLGCGEKGNEIEFCQLKCYLIRAPPPRKRIV
jgi:hypothetical protein